MVGNDALAKKIAETKQLVIETDERDVTARYKENRGRVPGDHCRRR